MRTSQKSINKNLENEITSLLLQLLADLKTAEEVGIVLRDLLDKTELLAFAKRIAIAYYLNRKRTYQNIKDNLQVSTATIASIDKKRGSEGYQLALKNIEAERWASEWTEKIGGLFKKS